MNTYEEEVLDKIKMCMRTIDKYIKMKKYSITREEEELLKKTLLIDATAINKIIFYIENNYDIHDIPQIIHFIYNLYKNEISSSVNILIILNFIIDVLIECEIQPFMEKKEVLQVIDYCFALLETKLETTPSIKFSIFKFLPFC